MKRCCRAVQELLCDAVLDHSVWPAFLEATNRCLEADSSFIMSAAPTPAHRPAYEVGLAQGTIRDYYEYFHHIDMWWGRSATPPPGQFALLRGEDLCTGHALIDSEFFAEFLDPNDIRHMRALVVTPAAPLATPWIMSWHRSAGRAPFDERDDEMVRGLGLALVQGERMGSELLRARIDNGSEEAPALFALGANGGVLQTNSGGLALLESGLADIGSGRLRLASAEATAWLRTLLERAAIRSGPEPCSETPASCSGIAMPRAIRRGHASVCEHFVVRLGDSDPDMDHRLAWRPLARCCGSISLIGSLALLIVQPVRGKDSDSLAARMASRYGWTPSEFDTVWRLARNASTQEIADARQCSVETVRTHLKHAKRKAGVRRQVELVTLLMAHDGE